MKRKRKGTSDAGRLMDRLVPDPGWGPILGILATTHDLDADFVETDWLPAVFGLGAWDDRSWASRIALEKALAGLRTCTLLVEGRAFQRRPRSLRVEVIPARGAQLQHAKVTLIVYENAVRLLVGSHNLTEAGYRYNREVSADLFASAETPELAAVVEAALRDMQERLLSWWTEGCSALVAEARARLQAWAATPPDGLWWIWGGGAEPIWRAFRARWPVAEPIHRIHVVSPFWSEERGDGPLARLVQAFEAKGCELELYASADPDPLGTHRPRLPASLAAWDARTLGVRARAWAVDPSGAVEGRDDLQGTRELHAKIVLVEGPTTSLAYVGSANFTWKGWGFGDSARSNVEAGVVLRRKGSLRHLLPPTSGAPIELDGDARGLAIVPAVQEGGGAWPTFVRDVRLVIDPKNPSRLALSIHLDRSKIEGPVELRLPGAEQPLDLGTSTELLRALESDELRRLVEEQAILVRWWETEEPCEFPVNVDAAARHALPIAPGSEPNEDLLLAYYQGRISWEALFPPSMRDDADAEEAEARALRDTLVDTSRIQSYQIREFVEALQGIREDLRNACVSEPAIRLALLGPVSPVALADQVVKAVDAGRRTPTAAGFQLLEILACLWEAKRQEVAPGLRAAWSAHVDEAVARVERFLARVAPSGRSFAEFEKAIRRFHAGGEA